jgi:hypothetical protein
MCLFCVACGSLAQEALRISLAGESAEAARRAQLENQSGNVDLGFASLLLGAGLTIELNDNVNYSDIGVQEDVILRPSGSVAASVPFSQANTFYITLGIGYAHYLRYSQYDTLTIQPGSQLGFDVYVKDFHFNIHDEVALTQQPVAQGTISGTANYALFSNTVGLGADWDLNDLVISMDFNHQNSISTESMFSYLDGRSESLFVRASFQLSDAVSAGPEASAGQTVYDQHVLNDSVNYSFGGFADWQVSQHFHVKSRVGYTAYSFQSETPGQALPNQDSYYLDLGLSHRLNEIVSYTINAGRQLRLGINSELIDLWYANAGIGLRLIDQVGLGPHFVFEQGTDSGSPILAANERYTLLGGGFGITYQLMEKMLTGVSYDYTTKDSNLPGRSYNQNRIQIQFQYTF